MQSCLKTKALFILFLSCACVLNAQQSSSIPNAPQTTAESAQQKAKELAPVRTTVTVLGDPTPVLAGESARSVVVMNTETHPLAFNTVEDYLRTDSSVQINQRGSGGYPADISIRGTSFEQTLVLLDGFRVNDSQAAHNNLDLPVPLADLANIEVLHGAGSTLYGADALGGVVDFVTRRPDLKSLWVSGAGGSFGENQQTFVGSYAHRNWAEQIAGHREYSSGFMYDRDFRNENASSESWLTSPLGVTDLLLGGSDTPFGANNFYGNYPSYERTKGWFASILQDVGPRTNAGFAYRRHTDNFILIRDDPAYYANNHIDSSWQAVVRSKSTWSAGKNGVYYGLDFDGDEIHSNNLGRHARNWGSGYADLDLRSWKRGTLSVGAREEIISGGYDVFSPMAAAAFWIASTLKARAAVGYGFRLPTYTDLYYSDPTTVGNPRLKPESAWNYEGGLDWFPRDTIGFSVTGFYSPQSNYIDYVRTSPAALWHATNLNGLSFAGTETSLIWHVNQDQQVNLSWTWLDGAQSVLHGLQSEYVFNYPVHNAVFNWYVNLGKWVMVNTRVGVEQRFHQTAYPLWDMSLVHEHGRVQPFVQITNLSNTGYDEIPEVRMPGRAFIAGVKIWIFTPQ